MLVRSTFYLVQMSSLLPICSVLSNHLWDSHQAGPGYFSHDSSGNWQMETTMDTTSQWRQHLPPQMDPKDILGEDSKQKVTEVKVPAAFSWPHSSCWGSVFYPKTNTFAKLNPTKMFPSPSLSSGRVDHVSTPQWMAELLRLPWPTAAPRHWTAGVLHLWILLPEKQPDTGLGFPWKWDYLFGNSIIHFITHTFQTTNHSLITPQTGPY